MGIKDILVHLDDSAATEGRLGTAILYAKKHGACLRGFYPITHAYYEPRDIGEKPSLERIETLFREKTEAAGIAAEWVSLDSAIVGASVSDVMTMQAYYSDMVVIGQTNIRNPDPNIPTDFPEHMVKACGRPVLVVPYAGSFETAGDRILVAWKAGRESVRSLSDGMPHVKKASYVSVVGISSEVDYSVCESQIKGVGNYLARHEVIARTDCICNCELSVGDTILNLACEQSADMLVMGSFAPVLGGALNLSPVARHVLSHLTVPLLLSH